MGRFPLVDPASADPAAAELLQSIAGERGQAYNIYRTLAHSPGGLAHVYALARYLWERSSLPSDVQELVILRVAQLKRSDYEWSRHLPLAARAGVSEEQIVALGAWRSSAALFGDAQRRALHLAEQVTRQVEADADAVADAREALGEQGCVELILLAGFYGMVAGLLRSLAVDPEDGDVPMPDPDAAGAAPVTHYVRIHADDAGESHFEDVSLPVTTRRSPVSTAQAELADPIATDTATFRRVIVDHPATAHAAPRRQLVVHLRGEAEVEVSDGEVRRFGPGSAILVDDLTGKGHLTRRVGDVPRETLMVTLEDDAPSEEAGPARG